MSKFHISVNKITKFRSTFEFATKDDHWSYSYHCICVHDILICFKSRFFTYKTSAICWQFFKSLFNALMQFEIFDIFLIFIHPLGVVLRYKIHIDTCWNGFIFSSSRIILFTKFTKCLTWNTFLRFREALR